MNEIVARARASACALKRKLPIINILQTRKEHTSEILKSAAAAEGWPTLGAPKHSKTHCKVDAYSYNTNSTTWLGIGEIKATL